MRIVTQQWAAHGHGVRHHRAGEGTAPPDPVTPRWGGVRKKNPARRGGGGHGSSDESPLRGEHMQYPRPELRFGGGSPKGGGGGKKKRR